MVDLEILIDNELWEAIRKDYNDENYTGAITKSFFYLTSVIRDKSGADSDGTQLIGESFGGAIPKIMINNLQTESERNIQKGTQDILRGLYSAIRNPRSHGEVKDTKQEADSIILFIDYNLKIINKSKNSFKIDDFLVRVFDRHFVQKKEYAELLISEIPKKKKVDVAIEVILKRKKGDFCNLNCFMRELLKQLSENEINLVSNVISDELKYTSEHIDIRTILAVIPGEYWAKVNKAVKMRVENILFDNLCEGIFEFENVQKGALATWITDEYLRAFENIDDNWQWQIITKLEGEIEHRDYIKKYFLDKLITLNEGKLYWKFKNYIKKGLIEKNEEIITIVEKKLSMNKEHIWWTEFSEELKEYPGIKYDEFWDDFSF